MPRMYGKALAARWGVPVRHALYRRTGDWYHQLEEFPGALFDANGYIIFETAPAFHSCPDLRFGQDLNVPQGIQNIPGYVQVVVDGEEQPLRKLVRTTYDTAVRLREGAPLEVTLTRYERDPQARATCIAHHGFACAVCRMTFTSRYGEIGNNFIHVHHLEQLARAGERDVDPVEDLRPVCPNCHAMLHRRTPPLSIPELKRMLRPGS